MTILHIDSSARGEGSITRALSQYLVSALDQPVIRRDLGLRPLPEISPAELMAVHDSIPSEDPGCKAQLALSNELIEELRAVDTVVMGVPMYNFGVPASLKQWIDAVCRAGVSFSYSAEGPQGLLDVRRVFLLVSSGGTPVGSAADFVTPYLQHICRFIGIEEIHVIDAGGSKRDPDGIIARARRQIDELLSAGAAD